MLGEKVIVHHWTHVPNEARKHCCVPDLKYRYSAEAVPFDFCHKGLAGIFEVLAYGLRAGFEQCG